jgi:hypothetical protein
MRDIIATQLATGAGPDQVRDYFVGRYGEWVLLAPPARDLGVLLWAAPALAVAGGLLAASRLSARRRLPQPARWAGAGLVGAATLAVLLAANTVARGAGELPTGNIPAAAVEPGSATGEDAAQPVHGQPVHGQPVHGQPVLGQPEPAQRMAALRDLVVERPDDVAARLALAAEAFAAGRPDVVREQADAVLAGDPDHVDALLLRGLAATGPDDTTARAALQRFLTLAPPQHPGVPLARAATAGAP